MSDKKPANGASNGASAVNKIVSNQDKGVTSNSNVKKTQPFAGRTEDIRVLIKSKHTSPNKEAIIEVFKGQPKQIDGFDDLDGIAKMLGYHASEVDELLTTLQKGVKGPPYHEELIQYRFKDGAIRAPSGSTNYLLCSENSTSSKGDALKQGNRSSSGPGFNSGPNRSMNTSGPGSSRAGPESSRGGPASSKSGLGSSRAGPGSSKSGSESAKSGSSGTSKTTQEDLQDRNVVIEAVKKAIRDRR
jgi:hypothetical protein